MHCFRVITYKSGNSRIAHCGFALVQMAALFALQAPAQDTARSATVQGFVRDSLKHAIAGATVCLQVKEGTSPLCTHTDSKGAYRFSAVPEGTHRVRTELAGYREATSATIIVRQHETKSIDLTLEPLTTSGGKNSSGQDSSAPAPEFFDEPQFTVAAVTDPTNLGGHGSDTTVRTRESLAKATATLGKSPDASQPTASAVPAEDSWRQAVQHDPGNVQANYQLGKLLLENGRSREAVPYLEQASRLSLEDYESAYELARALAGSGDYARARMNAKTLLARTDKAELHHFLGDIEEKSGDSLAAVREYQRASELNPNEANLFDWGSELLMHRAVEPAIEVFTKGNRLSPQSVRMLVGLGVSWYVRGSYDQAIQRLGEASDLNPNDPTPYMFLGRIQNVESNVSEEVRERMQRFAKLHPDNAWANYYYAVSLWKRRNGPEDHKTSTDAESLLKKAVQLDPELAAGYLELGVLYSERKDFPQAISAFQNAIKANPQSEEAHYRLAQAYRQAGRTSEAKAEIELYEKLAKDSAAQAERERREIQQFVYTMRATTPVSNPQ